MNSGDSADFTRLKYDDCDYQRRMKESVGPYEYRTQLYAVENPSKCRVNKNKFHFKYDLVDQELELKNITRHATKCPEGKYNPKCNCKTCHNTFSDFFPQILNPSNCPIIHNNLRKSK